MRVHSPYKCDYCGKIKLETNHWWLRETDIEMFALMTWRADRADDDCIEHICGHECATKALAKYMGAER